MTLPKIFLVGVPETGWAPDLLCYAIAEDGIVLAEHISSNVNFAKKDLGLTTHLKHEHYREHYPNGYDLEWVDYEDLDSHGGFQVAWKKNQSLFGVAN